MLHLSIGIPALFGKVSCRVSLLFIFLFNVVLADEVRLPPIKIGLSTNEGHIDRSSSGIKIKEGIQIYFDHINADGGIKGRKLQLIALDDEYEPERAASNVRELIDQENVLALLGNSGTPTSLVVLPIISEKKIVLFSPFSGAAFLYENPPNHYVFTFRASYADEVEAIFKGLSEAGIKPDEVAFFLQKDAFGDEIYNNAMRVLKKEGFPHPEKLPLGQFTRNSENVENGLAALLLRSTDPKVIIIASQQKVASNFIKMASKEFPKALFVVTSAARDIEEVDIPLEADIVISQLTPYFDSKVPALEEYYADLKKYAPNSQPSVFSFASYLATKLFVKALFIAEKENKLNREGLVEVIENMHTIDVGIGSPVGFSQEDHVGLDKVWFTRKKEGKYATFKWEDLKSK